MQINRLFEIVYLLLDRREMTAKELADHFEVSSRTILRDIEALSMAGIPIYTAQGKGGGVRLLDRFVLSKSVLTDREQQDILSALQGLRAVQVPETDKVLAKLNAIFNKSASSWIDIDFSPWDSASGERDKFSLLRDAILARRLVHFDYYSYFGEKTSRAVEPLQITFKEKAWYLSAFCRERADYRTFKLSRMKRLAIADETFAPRELRAETSRIAPQTLCTVTLRMEEAAYCRMGAEFAEEKIRENEDGSFTVTTLLPDDEWGYSYLLSFGEQAEVLFPAHIRRLVGEKLAAAAKRYVEQDRQLSCYVCYAMEKGGEIMKWTERFPRTSQPSFAEIGEALQNPLWDRLSAHMDEVYGIEPKIEYSVCSGAPGWNVKYRKGGRSLCVLYPNLEFFTCLVCIGAREQMEAELLLCTCTQYTRALYESCGGMGGTRWMMVAVTSPEILEDVKALISTRRKKGR